MESSGFLFGLLRGVLLLVIAFMAFAWFVKDADQPEWLTEAKVTPMLREGARELEKILPEGWKTDEEEARRLKELDRHAAELDRLRRGFNLPAPALLENRASDDKTGYNAKTRRELETLLRAAEESGHVSTGR